MSLLRRQSPLPVPTSLLDRLLNADAPGRAGPTERPALLRTHLVRDIALLLNTRRPSIALPASLSHLPDSLLTYGLEDAAGARALDSARLIEDIRTTLVRHEPRLTEIHVERLSDEPNDEGLLEIAITASVREDGSPLHLRLAVGSATAPFSVEEVRV